MATATPSLAPRALLQRAALRAGFEAPVPITAGLSPAGKAFAAVSAARAADGVTVLVVPTDKDVEQMTTDARFFLASLEGAPESTVESAV